jgi:antirestriction protein
MTDTPRVFLTDLHAYNSGSLHGHWVDATDEDDMMEAVKEILASSPHPGGEEWFISDYANFGPYRVGEYEPLGQVAAVATAIEEHGIAVAAWLSAEGELDKLDNFSDYFAGEVDEGEYAKDAFEELCLEQFRAGLRQAEEHAYRPFLLRMFEDSIEPYIDTERAGESFLGGMTFVHYEGTTYAFHDEA